MVVFQIYVMGIAVAKAESHPPVGPDRHGPCAPAIALERMQPKRRLVHILHVAGLVERGKDQAQAIDLVGSDSAAIVLFEQGP